MRMWAQYVTAVAGLVLLSAATTRGAAPDPGGGGRRALLIGCTEYPNLDRSKWLTGPANDVALMRHLLETRYRFAPGEVTVLTETAGGPLLRPTRANIEREFRRLTAESRRGDQVVILLSGHGSQQPDERPDPHNDPEPDGLDEIFLPADAGRWVGERHTVANAIVDDELNVWLCNIQRTGAYVWLIVDSCHSGTMMRGVDTVRQVRPEDLGIPVEALSGRSRESAPGPVTARDGSRPSDAAFAPSVAEGMVAIYAAQPGEPTFEMGLPQNSEKSKSYGLLTYTINEVLTSSHGPLTYRQLVEGVYSRYAAMGRRSPTPMIEGHARDKAVLGEGSPNASRIYLSWNAADAWTVNAGALHGLTAGTILAVSPRAGEGRPDAAARFVRVKDRGLSALDASVEPCSYPEGSNAPVSSELPEGGLCEVVFSDFGDMSLSIAADNKDGKGDPLPLADLDCLKRTLASLDRTKAARSRVVSEPADADWLLHAEEPGSRTIYLIPASGVPYTEGGKPSQLFGPVPGGELTGPWLGERLARIAAAQNLLRVVAASEHSSAEGAPIGMKVEMLKYTDLEDKVGHPLVPATSCTELRQGDSIGFRLANSGRDPVDVTLLLVDSEYGIAPVFPTQFGLDNRLQPGESLIRRFRVTVSLPGPEHLIVIAAKAKINAVPCDFSFLGQSSIERARSAADRSRGAGETLTSGFGQLLLDARYNSSGRRGLETVELGRYELSTLSWRTIR